MMNIGQQVMSALDEANNANPDDYSSYHFLQDLYVGDDGSMYCISVSNGKLYRWGVQIAQDNTVTLATAQEVKPVFTTAKSQTINITKRTDGRFEGFAVLGTCALNKDGEIDSRALFDCFVDRFHGGREYVNIYHLGGDSTKIGEIDFIFREGNLLVGHYVLDDNIVAQRVGETLVEDKKGEWGGSIEFLSDDEGEPVVVAEGIVANVYTKGTLRGFSIALAEHGAAWGTSHFMTRTPEMNDSIKATVSKLLKDDPQAVAMLQTWLDDTNTRLSDSITRTETPVTHEAAAVEQAPVSEDAPPPSDSDIVIDESLLEAITQALVGSEWMKEQITVIETLSARVAALEDEMGLAASEAAAAEDEAAAEEQTIDPAAMTEQIVNAVTARLEQIVTERVAAIEGSVSEMRTFYERSMPQQPVVQSQRPGTLPRRAVLAPPQPVQVLHTAVPGTSLPPAAQPTSIKALYKRPNKTMGNQPVR